MNTLTKVLLFGVGAFAAWKLYDSLQDQAKAQDGVINTESEEQAAARRAREAEAEMDRQMKEALARHAAESDPSFVGPPSPTG